jgi:hypothetical protein
MIVVAVVAILFGVVVRLWGRRVSFKRRADDYAKKSYSEMLRGFRVQHARWTTPAEDRMGEEHFRLMDYYDELKAKYERAAARPWLPVAPDRPAPQWPEGVPRTPPQSWVDPARPAAAVRLADWNTEGRRFRPPHGPCVACESGCPLAQVSRDLCKRDQAGV